jgi:hypothetical protein
MSASIPIADLGRPDIFEADISGIVREAVNRVYANTPGLGDGDAEHTTLDISSALPETSASPERMRGAASVTPNEAFVGQGDQDPPAASTPRMSDAELVQHKQKEKEKLQSYTNIKSLTVGGFSLGAQPCLTMHEHGYSWRAHPVAIPHACTLATSSPSVVCLRRTHIVKRSRAASCVSCPEATIALDAGVFVQNLVILLKLPAGRPKARGLLIANLVFASLGIAITSFLATTKWDTLHKSCIKVKGDKHQKDQTRLLCGGLLQVLNYIVALCALVVSITSSALGSFVLGEGQVSAL